MTRRAPAAWLRADDTYKLRGRSSEPHLDHIVGEQAEKSMNGTVRRRIRITISPGERAGAFATAHDQWSVRGKTRNAKGRAAAQSTAGSIGVASSSPTTLSKRVRSGQWPPNRPLWRCSRGTREFDSVSWPPRPSKRKPHDHPIAQESTGRRDLCSPLLVEECVELCDSHLDRFPMKATTHRHCAEVLQRSLRHPAACLRLAEREGSSLRSRCAALGAR